MLQEQSIIKYLINASFVFFYMALLLYRYLCHIDTHFISDVPLLLLCVFISALHFNVYLCCYHIFNSSTDYCHGDGLDTKY